jgi:serine/threonine-protein kinase
MAKKFTRHAGEIIGDWKLIEPINAGGNAEVWKANNDEVEPVALKILYQKNPDSEPYKRFRAEITFLRLLGEQPGVLTIKDASLPKQPSGKNPAWLAMPIATPIIYALGKSPKIEK